jgi:hypothetical protein
MGGTRLSKNGPKSIITLLDLVLHLLVKRLMSLKNCTVYFIAALLFTCGLVSSHALAKTSSDSNVLAFKVWKQKKIDEAQAYTVEIKREIKQATDQSATQKHKLAQAEVNLKVSRDLSANDYFVLYLTPQFKDDNEALIQASKHLTPKDFADILRAYQKTLDNGAVLGTSKAATSSYDETL